MVLATLPPSWNAHRHALKVLGLDVDAVDCFGFGGGLGFLYHPGATPLFLGFGSLDPMEDLAITAGAWVDQKHSVDRHAAVNEMRDHLAREKTPVIVSLSTDGGEDEEIEAVSSKRTFVSVFELREDRVSYQANGSERELDFAAWLARRSGDARRWAVVISNRRFTDVRRRVRSSLKRSVHRMTAGWRGRLGGMPALERFFAELPDGLDHQATLRASTQLGGGLGRGLFASFLDRYEAQLPARDPQLAAHFRDLDSEWRTIEAILSGRNRPDARALERITRAEAEGLERLRRIVDARETRR